MTYEKLSRLFFGPLVVLLIVSVVLDAVFAVPFAATLRAPVAFACVFLAIPGFDRVNFIMLAVIGLASLISFATDPETAALMVKAFANAAFFGAFFAGIGMLRLVSQTSPAMDRCGRMLVSRPPGQRYAALTFGSMIFSMVLNFGAIVLLGGILRTASDRMGDKGTARQDIRERRMMMALVRGYSGNLMTSPTAFSFIIVLSLVPEIDWWTFLPLSFSAALLFLLVGWIYDRLAFQRGKARLPAGDSGGYSTALPVLAVLFAITGGAAAVEGLLDCGFSEGVLISAPCLAMAWIFLQQHGRPAERLSGLAGRMRRLVAEDIVDSRREIGFVILLSLLSMLMSSLARPYVSQIHFSALSAYPQLYVAILIFSVLAAAQIGLNPFVAVMMFGSLLPSPGAMGLLPAVMALSLLTGWSLSAGLSTATAAIHITASLTRRNVLTVAYAWNGVFTITAALALFLYLSLLNWLLS